jgi:hypothetical protein
MGEKAIPIVLEDVYPKVMIVYKNVQIAIPIIIQGPCTLGVHPICHRSKPLTRGGTSCSVAKPVGGRILKIDPDIIVFIPENIRVAVIIKIDKQSGPFEVASTEIRGQSRCLVGKASPVISQQVSATLSVDYKVEVPIQVVICPGMASIFIAANIKSIGRRTFCKCGLGRSTYSYKKK